MPGEIEQCVPSLSTRDLKVYGLLSCPAQAEVKLGFEGSIDVQHQIPDRVRVSGGPLRRPQLIALAWGDTPFGRSPFFICPVNGRRCRKLYLIDGKLVSRTAGGLTYQSQHQDAISRLKERSHKLRRRVTGDDGKRAPVGEARNRLLKQLGKIHWQLSQRGVDDDELLRFLWNYPPQRPDAPKRRVRPPSYLPQMSTRRALREGRKANPKPSGEIVRFLEETFSEGRIAPPAQQAHQPKRLGGFPELDIRPLRPRRGLARALKLRWAPNREGDALDLTGMITKDERRLVLIGFDEAPPKFVKQEIQLVKGRRHGDFYMICPINGTRHTKLYFRGGFFASRKVQGLLTRGEAGLPSLRALELQRQHEAQLQIGAFWARIGRRY